MAYLFCSPCRCSQRAQSRFFLMIADSTHRSSIRRHLVSRSLWLFPFPTCAPLNDPGRHRCRTAMYYDFDWKDAPLSSRSLPVATGRNCLDDALCTPMPCGHCGFRTTQVYTTRCALFADGVYFASICASLSARQSQGFSARGLDQF